MISVSEANKKVTVMDIQKLINVLAALLIAIGGWWCNNMSNSVMQQQIQITQLNIELAKNYVPRAELQDTFRQINASLEEIKKSIAERRK